MVKKPNAFKFIVWHNAKINMECKVGLKIFRLAPPPLLIGSYLLDSLFAITLPE